MADEPATDVNVSEAEAQDLGEALVEATTTTEEASTPEESSEQKDTDKDGDKPAEESSEKDQPEETDKSEEASEESEPADKAEDSEEPTDENTPNETESKRTADARKEKLQSEIRELVTQRNRVREEVAELNNQKYRTQTEEELVANGYDPEEAREEARQQREQLEAYNRQVADINQQIEIETRQVFHDMPIFDERSDQYDKELHQRATDLYTRVANLEQDPQTGLYTQANVMPYEIYRSFYETFTTASERAKAQGQIDGQKATHKMLASAEPQSSAPAPENADDNDPFLQGFSRV